MAFLRVIIFVLACQSIFASEVTKGKQGKDEERTIFIDGGQTGTPGDVVDIFLYFGTFTLAVLTALAIIGIIFGIVEGSKAKGTGYGDTGFGASGYGTTGFEDSYSGYDRIYDVARSLYDGYKKYEAARNLEE